MTGLSLSPGGDPWETFDLSLTPHGEPAFPRRDSPMRRNELVKGVNSLQVNNSAKKGAGLEEPCVTGRLSVLDQLQLVS